MKASKFEKILNICIPAFIIFFIIGFSALGIYGGIESEAFTLTTLPIWIWNNSGTFYWSIAAITCGHCLAQLNSMISS